MEGELVGDIHDAELVVFTGGEDIDPAIYGKNPHKQTWFNRARDNYEIQMFNLAREEGKKIVGICRGAQLTCALAGGILVQHQHHPWKHEIITNDGRKITTTSTHHQRQYPWGGKKPNFELLAWANHLSPFAEGESKADNLQNGSPEAEIVLYPDVKALAIQGHPEFAYPYLQPWEEEFIGYCREQLNNLMAL